MNKPLYTAHAQVTGSRVNGRGRTADGMLDVALRMPKEMGGDGNGVNPEQLFAVGYAACFATVIELLGQRDKINAGTPVINAAVALVPKGDGTFELAATLDVALSALQDPQQASDLVRAAHGICPYSNATRGNMKVTIVVNGSPL
jgi:lipoyl-dependent peroxiredoxin